VNFLFHLNTTQDALKWDTHQTAERLMILINDTMLIPRLLLMQLCEDHPVCHGPFCFLGTPWTTVLTAHVCQGHIHPRLYQRLDVE